MEMILTLARGGDDTIDSGDGDDTNSEDEIDDTNVGDNAFSGTSDGGEFQFCLKYFCHDIGLLDPTSTKPYIFLIASWIKSDIIL
jgi:hypothetical protein